MNIYFIFIKMSGVWNFFEKIKGISDQARCLLCSEVIKTSKNTSNAMFHLKRKHSEKEKEEFLRYIRIWSKLQKYNSKNFNSNLQKKKNNSSNLSSFLRTTSDSKKTPVRVNQDHQDQPTSTTGENNTINECFLRINDFKGL